MSTNHGIVRIAATLTIAEIANLWSYWTLIQDRRENVETTANAFLRRANHVVLAVADDPVFEGLPREFEIMESHCGQIEYAPSGWVHLVDERKGPATRDYNVLRVKDRYIYAAQFHIEMAGTSENSRQIMGNFSETGKRRGAVTTPMQPRSNYPRPLKSDEL